MEHSGRNLPNNLRRYRKMHGYSQKAVARKIGLSSHVPLSEWESGKSFPNLTNLFKLSIIYATVPTALYEADFLHLKVELTNKTLFTQEEV